jgi:hypothetical protein
MIWYCGNVVDIKQKKKTIHSFTYEGFRPNKKRKEKGSIN